MENLTKNAVEFIESEIKYAKEVFNTNYELSFETQNDFDKHEKSFLKSYDELQGKLSAIQFTGLLDVNEINEYRDELDEWKSKYNDYMYDCKMKLNKLVHPQVKRLEEMMERHHQNITDASEYYLKNIVGECIRSYNELAGAISMLSETEVISYEQSRAYFTEMDMYTPELIDALRKYRSEVREKMNYC